MAQRVGADEWAVHPLGATGAEASWLQLGNNLSGSSDAPRALSAVDGAQACLRVIVGVPAACLSCVFAVSKLDAVYWRYNHFLQLMELRLASG